MFYNFIGLTVHGMRSILSDILFNRALNCGVVPYIILYYTHHYDTSFVIAERCFEYKYCNSGHDAFLCKTALAEKVMN